MNNKVINKSFYIVMFSLIAIFSVALIINPLGDQLNVFFAKTKDFMADFFNVQIYIADWDPYHNTINGMGEKCYLPFTYLFLELFNGFYNYSGASLSECYTSSEAVLSCVMFMFFSLFVFYHSLSCIKSIPNSLKFVLFFSSIILFSIERGNIIILCSAFMCYFLAYKDSGTKWLRYFALICLCLASVIKVYPAVLGLFLLQDKRYKAILGCSLLSLVLVFLPFVFFEGRFENVGQLLANVSNNSSSSYSPLRIFPRFGISPLVGMGLVALHMDETIANNILIVPKFITILLCVVSFVLFFFEKNNWKKVALLILPLMMFPTNSAFYCGMYFFPVILLFFCENQGRKLDFIYMILICALLNPIQIVFQGISISFSYVLSNISAILFWILLISEGIVQKSKAR